MMEFVAADHVRDGAHADFVIVGDAASGSVRRTQVAEKSERRGTNILKFLYQIC